MLNKDSYESNTFNFYNPDTYSVSSGHFTGDNNIAVKLEEGATIPMYYSAEAAGADMSCLYETFLEPNKATLVDTGVSIALPLGSAGMVYLRSSLGSKGVILCNGVGVIDSDYRGTIKLCMMNTTNQLITFEQGTRLAQLIITPIIRVGFRAYTNLNHTNRGNGSFGSTGQR